MARHPMWTDPAGRFTRLPIGVFDRKPRDFGQAHWDMLRCDGELPFTDKEPLAYVFPH